MDNKNFILGNELFVFDASTGTPLAYSTECSLSVSADNIDCSNKMSGWWASAIPGTLSWEISTSAMYSSAADWGYGHMFEAMKDRTPYKIRFGLVENYGAITDYTDPDNYVLDTAKEYYEGFAYITSLEMNAGNGEVASFSITFTGDGALDKKN